MEATVMSILQDPSILTTESLNNILTLLANAKETDALVRIWDLKEKHLVNTDTKRAIMQLHNLGKGKIPNGTIHPPEDRRRLAPARRLHKICKFWGDPKPI
jgi:hypothetical protein